MSVKLLSKVFDQDSVLSFLFAITVFSDVTDDTLESWTGSSRRGSGGTAGRWVIFTGEDSGSSLEVDFGVEGDMPHTCKDG